MSTPDGPAGPPPGAQALAPEDGGPIPGEPHPAPSRLSFPVVGIGASAGGLEALESLTHQLTARRMAFVVVQHLAPGHVSMLADILARGTSLRVVTVVDKMRVESGTIYVAPPTVELSVDGEQLRVTSTADSRKPRYPIDAFFRSLARTGGSMAIGVVLSGSGSDGTLGLKAIKDEGGITFAQQPSTAVQSSMPQSAIDGGCADFSLSPAEIGDELMRLSEHPYVGRARPVQFANGEVTGTIFGQLRAAYGIDFALYKPSTVERRIGRRMALHKLERVEDYVTFLGSDPNELRSLYNDLLIGVTTFFRDTEPFDALRGVVFPRLFEHRATEAPIRIWVAGCATGEEAYSVAIALLEYLGDRASAYKIQIFATDMDDDALARARNATYPHNIDLDVSPGRLQRFFARTDKGYQVVRHVRDLVVFARHNLGNDPPFSRLDLITCRNVLIYMQTRLQKKVLRIFHYALNADAYLLLGTSESVGDATDGFSVLDRKLKVYVKKNTPPTAVFDLSFWGRAPNEDDGKEPPAARPVASVAQMADRKVIDKYAPPGVIVDDRLDVMQFRGKPGPFLEPAPGTATLSLLKLVRPELLVALRTTAHASLTEGVAVSSPPIQMRGDRGPREVTLDVIPLPNSAGRKCLVILFNEATPRPQLPEAHANRPEPSEVDPRITGLERELAVNKEYLQSTVEELEAANEELQSSNEELQSSNEELQSSNEELQSTNEELETSKEELQSTNEELATVNDELQNRMAQLSIANDDLHNVLLNGTSAIVIVGADLRLRRFSSMAEKLLSLIPGDVGRPIAYLRNVMSARDVEQVASEALSSITVREQRVRCIDGSWYFLKIIPYVTADHMIRGLVLEFVRTAPPSATADVEPLHPLAKHVLSVLPQPLMLLDRQLRLVWANRAFFEAFSVGPAALGRPLSEAWGSTTEPADLWVFLEELSAGRSPRDLVIEHPFGRVSGRPMCLSGRIVPSEGDHPALSLVFMQEA